MGVTRVSVSGGNGIGLDVRGKKYLLDPNEPESADMIFVSHAHGDHLHEPSGETAILASDQTRKLSLARGYNFGKNHFASCQEISMPDSGHILGSRGFLLDGVFYTGDISLRSRAFLRRAELTRCDVLIMETTYGHPGYIFPSHDEICKKVNETVSQMFERGIPLVFLGYQLGKAQILQYLFSHWEPMYLHTSVAKMSRVCSELGVLGLNNDKVRIWDEAMPIDGLRKNKPWVMVAPAQSSRSGLLRTLRQDLGAVTIYFSGWAQSSPQGVGKGHDFAFPLSDHCDYTELMEIVKFCQPEKIYTVHGFAHAFAADLRNLGYDAQPLPEGQGVLTSYLK